MTLRELAPSSAELDQIAAVERDPAAGGMDLATWACWLQAILPGHRHGYASSLPPLEPTSAQPGTPAKVRVMMQRARRGMSLFHPDDAPLSLTDNAKERADDDED